jgi:hypothetical protein
MEDFDIEAYLEEQVSKKSKDVVDDDKRYYKFC